MFFYLNTVFTFMIKKVFYSLIIINNSSVKKIIKLISNTGITFKPFYNHDFTNFINLYTIAKAESKYD